MSAILRLGNSSEQILDIASEKETLLNSLIESVKQCHNIFGGKSQLATEQDSLVSILLLRLEAVLDHGLKIINPPSVVDRAAKQLGFSSSKNEKPAFWNFIRRLLTQHELMRFNSLKSISTDIGRGRAWLRASLNEHTFDKYVGVILDSDQIPTYYEDYAFLLEKESAQILRQIASSLISILFALKIDSEDLDIQYTQSTIYVTDFTVMDDPQPVLRHESPVEGPTTGNESVKPRIPKKKRKSRKKNAFIQDDSAVSNVNVIEEVKALAPPDLIQEATGVDGTSRDLNVSGISSQPSMETHGSLSSIASTVSSNLPTTHNVRRGHNRSLSDGVARIKPISSPSQSLLGLATSNQTALTMDELKRATVDFMKRREELERETTQLKNDLSEERLKIQQLEKENLRLHDMMNRDKAEFEATLATVQTRCEAFKIELKKKNSVIDNLRRRLPAETSLDSSDFEDSIEKAKDLEDTYEEKLSQIAEMHYDVSELNKRLQLQLLSSEKTMQQMEEELVFLRGPLLIGENKETLSFVNVWIPTAFARGSGIERHHIYQIYISIKDAEWNAYKRYHQFFELHQMLRKSFPIVDSFGFPPKRLIGQNDARVVEERRLRLQTYLRQAINYFLYATSRLRNNLSKETFIEFLPFFQPNISTL